MSAPEAEMNAFLVRGGVGGKEKVAIECGIVKLPRVPVAENISGEGMPAYRNLRENTCLVCKGDTYRALLMYQELADMACNRITAGITQAMEDQRGGRGTSRRRPAGRVSQQNVWRMLQLYLDYISDEFLSR